MNIEKILSEARTNPELRASYTFKLTESMKETFIRVCAENSLSSGAVLRVMLSDWLAEMTLIDSLEQQQLELPFEGEGHA